MSDDATLSDLWLSQPLNQAFSSSNSVYRSMTVPHAVTSVQARATLSYPPGNPREQFGGATMVYQFGNPLSSQSGILTNQYTVNVPLPVIPGTTPIIFTVTSESLKYTKSYQINIHRLSNDAQLASFVINPTGVANLNPVWQTNTYSYHVDYPHWNDTITVTGVYNYPLAHGYYTAPGAPSTWLPIASGVPTPALPLQVGDNLFQWKQVSEDTLETRITTVIVHRISNDPTMSSIGVQPIGSGLTPAYDRLTYNYSLTVQYASQLIGLTPTQNYPLGTTFTTTGGNTISNPLAMSFTTQIQTGTSSPNYPLEVGDNWVAVKGIAEDQFLTPPATIAYYTFHVHRLSNEPRLNSLTCSEAFTPVFDADIGDYSIRVANSVTGLTCTPILMYPLASMTAQYDAEPAVAHASTTPATYSLAVGDQTITFATLSEDTMKSRIYKVHVHRISSDATLAAVDADPAGSGLVPTFNSLTHAYSMQSDYYSPDVIFTSQTSNAFAAQRYKLGNDSEWSAWLPAVITQTLKNLTVGDTIVTIEVQAEDTVTFGTYTIKVTKLGNNAYLASLSSVYATPNPTFFYNILEYNSTISSTVNPFTFRATPIVATSTMNYSMGASGALQLASGATSQPLTVVEGWNTLTLIVQSQDKTKSVAYAWKIYQTSPDTTLSSLSTVPDGSGPVPLFDSSIRSYRVVVPVGTNSIKIQSSPSNPLAIQQLCLAEDEATCTSTYPSGGYSDDVALIAGGDVNVSVLVSAEERSIKGRYDVTIHVVSDVATLKALTITNTATGLTPSFASNVTSYDVYVASSAANVQLFPVATNPHSTITYSRQGAAYQDASFNNITLEASGDTYVDIQVTAESGRHVTYHVIIHRASNDATAFSLTTVPPGSGLSPDFDSSVHSYTVTVENSVAEIAVQSKPTNEFASQRVCSLDSGACTPTFAPDSTSAPLSLVVGDNPIYLEVTSQEPWTKLNYTIVVHRASASSLLIALDSPVVNGFASSTHTYARTVGNSVNVTSFKPVTESPLASVSYTVNGGSSVALAYATSTPSIALQLGVNTIAFTVVSEDGTSTTIYTATVDRVSTDSTLSGITFFPPTPLSPAFDPAEQNYTVYFPPSTSDVSFSSSVNHGGATQSYSTDGGVTWTPFDNSGASITLPTLQVGDNQLLIRVTADDNVTESIYAVNMHRKSSDASLSSLLVSPSALVPSFSSATTSYTLAVSASTSSISLTPTPTYHLATLRYAVDSGTAVATPNGQPIAGGAIAIPPNADTPIHITCTAEDGTTTKTYTITVHVASDDASLQSMVASPSTGSELSPSFEPATLNYVLTFVSGTSAMQFLSAPTSAAATQQLCWVGIGCNVPYAANTLSQAIGLQPGDQNVTIRVTAESGRTQDYRLLVHVISNDASLGDLTTLPFPLQPPFQSDESEYTVNIPSGAPNVTIVPEPTSPTSTIEYQVDGGEWTTTFNGSVPQHADGSDVTIIVRVIAEDGTIKDYTITVHTVSSVSTLTSLSLTPCQAAIPFDSAQTFYPVVLSNAESAGVVSWTSSSPRSTVTFYACEPSGPLIPLPPDYASNLTQWPVGSSFVYVTNTAEDGIHSTTYIIGLYRKSADCSLLLLECGYPMQPPYVNGRTTGYRVVSPATANVTCTAMPTSPHAQLVFRLNSAQWLPLTSSMTGVLALDLGNNTLDLQCTAEDSNTLLYSITLYRASNDATLASFDTSLDPSYKISPFFERLTFNYGMELPSDVSALAILAVTNHPGATERFNQIELDPVDPNATPTPILTQQTFMDGASPTLTLRYNNRFEVVVTSEDGTQTNTYTLHVRHLSSDSSLGGIVCPLCVVHTNASTTPATGLYPPFNQSITHYNLTVPADTANFSLIPVPESPTSDVCFILNGGEPVCANPPDVTLGEVMGELPLETGGNTIDIIVVSEDGKTNTTYHFDITRLDDNARIDTVTFTQTLVEPMQPAFSPTELGPYHLIVRSAISSIDMSVVTQSATATLTYQPASSTSFVPSLSGLDTRHHDIAAVPLTTGHNLITLLSTAQDGTQLYYTFDVYRQDSYAIPFDLSVNPTIYPLQPPFDADNTTDYTVYVPYDQTTEQFQLTLTSDSQAATSMHTYTNATGTLVTSPSVAIVSGTWMDGIPVYIPSSIVHFTVYAEDRSVSKTYSVTVKRSPFQLVGWPSQMMVGEVRPVTVVPMFAGVLPSQPLTFQFNSLNGVGSIEPTTITLINATSSFTLWLHAPLENVNATMIVESSLIAPTDSLFGAPPQKSVTILPGSWEVDGWPQPDEPIYPNETATLTLTPDMGDIDHIQLEPVARDSNGNIIEPGPIIVSREPSLDHRSIIIELRLPADAGEFTIDWGTTGYVAPDSHTVTIRPRAHIQVWWLDPSDALNISLVEYTANHVPTAPQRTSMNMLAKIPVTVYVSPLALPDVGGVTIDISAPDGTSLSPSSLTFPEGDQQIRSFQATITTLSLRGDVTFTLSGDDARHFIAPNPVETVMTSRCDSDPPPCVAANTLRCENNPSPSYASSFTCTCKFGYSGSDCAKQDILDFPPDLDVPTAVLSPIATINNIACDRVRLDASASGGGYINRTARDTWGWNLTEVVNADGQHTPLNQLTTTITDTGVQFDYKVVGDGTAYTIHALFMDATTMWSSLWFPASELAAARFTFQLIVHGPYASSLPVEASVDATDLTRSPIYKPDPFRVADWMPRLNLIQPAHLRRTQTSTFQTSLIPSLCMPIPDNQTAEFQYEWNIQPIRQLNATNTQDKNLGQSIAPPRLPLGRLSLSSKELFVPKGFFLAGWVHRVSVSLTITVLSSHTGFRRRLLENGITGSTSASVDVTPSASTLVATITGAYSRQRPTTQPILFDGSASYDPDAQSMGVDSQLTFAWICYAVPIGASTSDDWHTFPHCQLSNDTAPVQMDQAELIFPNGSLPVGRSFVISLTVSTTDGRATTTHAVLTTGNPPTPMPLLTILPIDFAYWHSPNATFRATGMAISTRTPPTPSDELAWQPWKTSPAVSWLGTIALITPEESSSFALAPNTIPVGKYELIADVCEGPTPADDGVTLFPICATASVKFAMAAPPYGGTCHVTPTVGVEEQTVFTAECEGWQDPQHQRLTYTIKHLTPGPVPSKGQLRTLTAASETPTATFTLPAGLIPVEIWITNTLQTAYVWTSMVEVHAIDGFSPCQYAALLSLGEYSALNATLASGNLDRVLQMTSQVAELLIKGDCPCVLPVTQQVQRAVVRALAVAAGLVPSIYDLTLVESPPVLSAGAAQMIATSLAAITPCPLLDLDMWQIAALLTRQVIVSLPAPTPSLNNDDHWAGPWQVTFETDRALTDLDTTLAHLITGDCAQLDTIMQLQQELNEVRLAGTLPYEPVIITSAGTNTSIVHVGTKTPASNNISISITCTTAACTSVEVSNGHVSGYDGVSVNSSNFDSSSSAESASDSIDTSISTFPPQWTHCRSSTLPDGSKIISNITDIDFGMGGDQTQVYPVDIWKKINESEARMQEQQAAAAAADCNQPLPPPLYCSWLNETSGEWVLNDGCEPLGIEWLPDPEHPGQTYPTLHCRCYHQTLFAAIKGEVDDRNRCVESAYGATYHLIFLCIYTAIALTGLNQFRRVYGVSKWSHFLIASEHALIFGVALVRAINMAIFYFLQQVVSVQVKSVMASIPYLFQCWIATQLIVSWAAVVGKAKQGRRLRNAVQEYKHELYCINSVITLALLGSSLAMASDVSRVDLLSELAEWLIAIVCMAYGIATLYYGLRIAIVGFCYNRQEWERVNPVAVKLIFFACTLFICYAGAAIVLATSQVQATQNESALSSILYYSFDAMTYTLIIALLWNSVSHAVSGVIVDRTDGKGRLYVRGNAKAAAAGWMRRGSGASLPDDEDAAAMGRPGKFLAEHSEESSYMESSVLSESSRLTDDEGDDQHRRHHTDDDEHDADAVHREQQATDVGTDGSKGSSDKSSPRSVSHSLRRVGSGLLGKRSNSVYSVGSLAQAATGISANVSASATVSAAAAAGRVEASHPDLIVPSPRMLAGTASSSESSPRLTRPVLIHMASTPDSQRPAHSTRFIRMASQGSVAATVCPSPSNAAAATVGHSNSGSRRDTPVDQQSPFASPISMGGVRCSGLASPSALPLASPMRSPSIMAMRSHSIGEMDDSEHDHALVDVGESGVGVVADADASLSNNPTIIPGTPDHVGLARRADELPAAAGARVGTQAAIGTTSADGMPCILNEIGPSATSVNASASSSSSYDVSVEESGGSAVRAHLIRLQKAAAAAASSASASASASASSSGSDKSLAPVVEIAGEAATVSSTHTHGNANVMSVGTSHDGIEKEHQHAISSPSMSVPHTSASASPSSSPSNSTSASSSPSTTNRAEAVRTIISRSMMDECEREEEEEEDEAEVLAQTHADGEESAIEMHQMHASADAAESATLANTQSAERNDHDANLPASFSAMTEFEPRSAQSPSSAAAQAAAAATVAAAHMSEETEALTDTVTATGTTTATSTSSSVAPPSKMTFVGLKAMRSGKGEAEASQVSSMAESQMEEEEETETEEDEESETDEESDGQDEDEDEDEEESDDEDDDEDGGVSGGEMNASEFSEMSQSYSVMDDDEAEFASSSAHVAASSTMASNSGAHAPSTGVSVSASRFEIINGQRVEVGRLAPKGRSIQVKANDGASQHTGTGTDSERGSVQLHGGEVDTIVGPQYRARQNEHVDAEVIGSLFFNQPSTQTSAATATATPTATTAAPATTASTSQPSSSSSSSQKGRVAVPKTVAAPNGNRGRRGNNSSNKQFAASSSSSSSSPSNPAPRRAAAASPSTSSSSSVSVTSSSSTNDAPQPLFVRTDSRRRISSAAADGHGAASSGPSSSSSSLKRPVVVPSTEPASVRKAVQRGFGSSVARH